MDVIFVFSVIFVTLGINQVTALLKCVECTHMGWNQTYSFPNSQNIYGMLMSKFNPACSLQNPLDTNGYNQYMQENNARYLQQYGQFFKQVNYDVGETVCNNDRCNYYLGDVVIDIPSYGQMKINMHVRGCLPSVDALDNICYVRNRNINAYPSIKRFFEDQLSFLSRSVSVISFDGRQCLCNTDNCMPITSAGTVPVLTSMSLLLSLLYVYILK